MNHIKKLMLLSLFTSIFMIQCNKGTKDLTSNTTKVEQEVKDPAKAWRGTVPGPGEARPIEIGDYQSFNLDNGLTVIVVENHKLPRVSYQLSLKHKQIAEKEMVGMVDFSGQLLARGTTTKSKAEIDSEIDFIGANMNTSGYGMFGSSLKKHSGKLLDIMTDVLYNPSFPEDEFEKIKKQTFSNLQSAKTDPNTMVGNVRSVLNYGKDHPYGEIQTEEAVDKITIDACKAYYNTFYKPNNAYLIIVGDITLKDAKINAVKYFGQWKQGTVPMIDHPMPSMVDATNVSIVNKDGAVQSVINITYPVDLLPGSDDEIPSSVMNSVLGGGIFSGRLMQNLREDKAYTYGARSSLSSDRMVGNFNAFASVRNEVTDSSVTEFIHEMNRMVTEPVSADDLQLVKNSMAGSFARSLESPQTIARFALNTFRYNLPKDYYNTYLQKLDAVSILDVSQMAAKYIRPDKAHIVIAGNKDDISEKLLKFDADGKIDYYDAFGNEIKEVIALPEGLSGVDIINDYMTAIGGKDKLMSVKSLSTIASMELMGQQASIETYKKAGDKFAMKMSMAGNVMQEQKYDGVKGLNAGMGQKQIVTEGAPLDALKAEAKMFGFLDYATDGTTLELKGVENVDGVNCYKMSVTDAAGESKTQFYNMNTNLLVKEVSTQDSPQGQMIVSTEFSDYKDAGGIMMPHVIKIVGAAPFPLEMKISEVKVNSVIDDAMFTIE